MNLKNQLNELLERHHMSASDLSRELDLPKSTISDWLAGSNPKNIGQVKKVADLFEVTLDYLCFGEIPKKPNLARLDDYRDEINAGVFEVVLRRIHTKN